jgi:hypothetical protein
MPVGAPVRGHGPVYRRRLNEPGGRGGYVAAEPPAGFETRDGTAHGRVHVRSAHLCVATNGDLVFATGNPAQGATAWSSSYLAQGYNPLTAIACPSEQFCVGIDGGGNLISSSAPSADPSAWNVASLAIGSQGFPVPSLTCPSASWCAATTTSGMLITSHDASTRARWSTAGSFGLEAASCPTVTFCVGSDLDGAIHAGNVSGGGPAWSSQQVGAATYCERQYCYNDPLTAVSCPSTNLCATTDGNYLWTSTDPSAGDAVRAKSPLPSSTSKLYCPTESLCMAASNADVETTSDPADPSPHWTTMNLPKVVIPDGFGPAVQLSVSGLSRVSAQLCVAVDQSGGYAFVGNPSDPNSWTATNVDDFSPLRVSGAGSLTGVSCNPDGTCVAVDGTGHILVGTASG